MPAPVCGPACGVSNMGGPPPSFDEKRTMTRKDTETPVAREEEETTRITASQNENKDDRGKASMRISSILLPSMLVWVSDGPGVVGGEATSRCEEPTGNLHSRFYTFGVRDGKKRNRKRGERKAGVRSAILRQPRDVQSKTHEEYLNYSSSRFFVGLAGAMFVCMLLCLLILRNRPNNPLTSLIVIVSHGHSHPFLELLRGTVGVFFSLFCSPPRLYTPNSISRTSTSSFSSPSSLSPSKPLHLQPAVESSSFASVFPSPSSTPSRGAPSAALVPTGTVGNSHRSVSLATSAREETTDGSRYRYPHPDAFSSSSEDFFDFLSPSELRDFLLAEGWTETPNFRSTLPLELPGALPRLPRAGGGVFLRRHFHDTDAPPSVYVPTSAHVVLEHGRRLLSEESYAEAALALDHAVRPGHLTRAVRVHGQFLYPWKIFSDTERKNLRLMADQVRWFPKWIKNHRNSQRVDRNVLDQFLPVVLPRFSDKYGGPGSPSVNKSPGIRFTWLGHASALVNVDGLKILIDPMFEADLIGPYSEWLRTVMLYFSSLCGSLGERLRRPPATYETLPGDIDVVMLSHNHQDHIMEGDVRALCVRYAKKFKRLIWYVPEGVAGFLRQQGCSAASIFEFSWGETRTLSCHLRRGRRICSDGIWIKQNVRAESYKFTFTAGVHWSGRSPSKADHNTSLWGGFAVIGPKHKFFYGGDTAYWRDDFDEYKKIGQILGPFHLAALPIGAYEPNADLRYQHVKPWETVKMFKDVQAEIAVGVHWGTLRLSAEEFFDPMLDLECALLDLSEKECRSSHELRHRYKASEALWNYFRDETSGDDHRGLHGLFGSLLDGGERGRLLVPQVKKSEADNKGRTLDDQLSDSSSGGSGSQETSAGVLASSVVAGASFEVSTKSKEMRGKQEKLGKAAVSPYMRSGQLDALMKDDEGLFRGSAVERGGPATTKRSTSGELPTMKDLSSKQLEGPNNEKGKGAGRKKAPGGANHGRHGTARGRSRSTGDSSSSSSSMERKSPFVATLPLSGQTSLEQQRAKHRKEIESLLMELDEMMLPTADPIRHVSNLQRLLRSKKLQDAGILPSDGSWKAKLLKEGTRFQTLFLGQSLQVEAAENGDFLRMTRSSGLEHVRKGSPEENYTFSPLYFGKKGKKDVAKGRDAFLSAGSSLWNWGDSGGVDLKGEVKDNFDILI
ncbi:n-acyl-phosphatidylethanolamine-hydrolyzing phospholipase d family protein [Cystoisospora suis]|uniref:N-acyl-phosphatidylethanolamine-hydrolyzing phospholipase d family protein n=1 Tax=Cystoisospora suis TaxID=483139 RepID=A0A2C6KML9_9APIC|nr:n-acyl-phosphatidylethanolamine-hydrolyzing phospholipase d family protein [Cystoisospora suis]